MRGFIKWILSVSKQTVEEARGQKSLEMEGSKLVEDASQEKFVDPETGKVYKTARSLKAAKTRRRNAEKNKGV